MIKVKIEKGMYIRHLDGINKVLEVLIDKNNSNLNRVYVENKTVFFDEIENANFNLIDLIELGDYVNGEKVKEKYFDYANKEYKLLGTDGIVFTDKKIKDIVTKEQFNDCKYVVERDE